MNYCLFAGAAAISSLLCSCRGTLPAANVDTVELRDSIIAAAKAAREAGGTELNYEASIAVSEQTGAAVVVPIGGLSPSFSASRGTLATTKVTIKVPIQAAAKQTPSRRVYQINPNTLRMFLKHPAVREALPHE